MLQTCANTQEMCKKIICKKKKEKKRKYSYTLDNMKYIK